MKSQQILKLLKHYKLVDDTTTLPDDWREYLFERDEAAAISELLDYFIEDNLDIVNYLSTRTKIRVMWIYNILDRNNPYIYKYPYLKKALEAIIGNER